jgi:hypothetical protein
MLSVLAILLDLSIVHMSVAVQLVSTTHSLDVLLLFRQVFVCFVSTFN